MGGGGEGVGIIHRLLFQTRRFGPGFLLDKGK